MLRQVAIIQFFQRLVNFFQFLIVTIETTKLSIKFSVAGTKAGGTVTLKANTSGKKEDQVILEVNEPVKQMFSLRYLNLFNQAQNLSAQVTLSLTPDVPLFVEYKFGKLGSLTFYLAPKFEEEY